MNDFLLDGNFDLLFENGDLKIGDVTRQNQTLLLLIEKGENREFPTTGVGIQSWVLDEKSGDLNGRIKREFEADGMNVEAIKLTGTNIQTEAYYD